MAQVLDGIRVVDLTGTSAGAIATMLLADYGADVVKVEPPAGDPVRRFPAATVWLRGKRSVVADLTTDHGRDCVAALVAGADVLVDDGPSAVAHPALPDDVPGGHPRLVRCRVTGYGPVGPLASRPAVDGLVQARTGVQYEQPGNRPGPIFYASPLPSYGAGLFAAVGISAALFEREASGFGQVVDTSMLQGVLAWTTMPWNRVETSTPNYFTYRPDCRDLMPTPCFETGDGSWFHPMLEILPVVLQELGVDMDALPRARGGCDATRAYQAAVQDLLLQRPRQRWLDLAWEHDLRAQPVQSVEEFFATPQAEANGVITELDVPDVGTVRQFAHPYRIVGRGVSLAGPPPTIGAHTDAIEPSAPASSAPRTGAARARGPLAGLRVLDFGLALAGPYGPMLLSDLGADVIRVDNARGRRAAGARAGDAAATERPSAAALAATAANHVWVACQRGKRSIALDIKTPEGSEIARKLVASADVIHHNMRAGAAERLGNGFADARALNPRIVYTHVTGFGQTGPLVDFPGSDQMAQSLSGLEHEQGAARAGGKPVWNRLGWGDHTAAILSVLGTVQALYLRELTGDAQLVQTDILSAASLLMSHLFETPPGGPTPWRLDHDQTGLGALYRLYPAAGDGWLCIAATTAEHWEALTRAIGRDDLAADPRFAALDARMSSPELADELASVFAQRAATEWFAVLDAAGVPCEVASDEFIGSWFDDPHVLENRMVAGYPHPVLGTVEQLGNLVSFSATPTTPTLPPVIPGQHTREILASLGYSDGDVAALIDAGAANAYEL